MIKRRQLLRWMAGLGVGLVIAGGFAWSRKTHSTLLPGGLPAGNYSDAFRQAVGQAQEKARGAPGDPENVRRLARLYHANGLYAEARACYDEIAARSTDLTACDHYYLADIKLNQNDLPAAEAELRAVIAQEPGYVPARLALATALFKTGREAEAEKEYAAVLATDPNNPQASLGLARLALQRGDDGAAMARLNDLMAAHPESASGAALFAQVLERRGEKDRALALNQWSRQKPEPIPPDPWTAELSADIFDVQRLGLKFEEYFKTGQVGEAMPYVRRIEELNAKSPLPEMLKGWSEAQTHHDAEASRHYRLALAKGGDAEKIVPYLVQSLLALGNAPEAAALVADYATRMPDSIPLAMAQADVAQRQNDEKGARVLLAKVLAAQPYLYAQNMQLAKLLWAANERDAAAVSLQRVAQVYANDVPSRALLGEYYLGKSDAASAIPVLEQANLRVAAQTSVADGVRALLGTAYAQAARGEAERGRWREAAAALDKLAALQPENPTVYLSLGDMRYQEGNVAEARRQWAKARPLVATGDRELRDAIEARLAGRITPETFR